MAPALGWKVKDVFDALLRTGFCLVWITALFFFAVNGAAMVGETDPLMANNYSTHTAISGVILLIGIFAHSYLIKQKVRQNPPNDRKYPDSLDF